MNEIDLRDRLWRAHDGVRGVADNLLEVAAEDLARGQAARRRRIGAYVGGAAVAVIVAATVGASAMAGVSRDSGFTPGAMPGGPMVSTTTTTLRPTETTTTREPGLPATEYVHRMIAAMQKYPAGSVKYLAHPDSRGGGGGQNSAGQTARLHVLLGWGVKDSPNRGYIEVEAISKPEYPGNGIICGKEARLPKSECGLVGSRDGAKVYYVETAKGRSASIVYPDGSQVAVIAMAEQLGNSEGATPAPLPTKTELVAIATDPELAWPGLVTGPIPF